MIEVIDVVTVLILAYWRTGSAMVAFDSQASPIDRPGYVRRGATAKLVAGATWPIVAKINQELGWHFVIFLSSIGVASLGYWAIGHLVDANFWLVLLTWLLCLSPVGSTLSALVSTALWPIGSKVFRWRMPDSVARQFNG